MLVTKMTVRTLAGIGAMMAISACGAATPTTAVLDVTYERQEAAIEEAEDTSGPSWHLLPEADRPQPATHRAHLGCILAQEMAPC